MLFIVINDLDLTDIENINVDKIKYIDKSNYTNNDWYITMLQDIKKYLLEYEYVFVKYDAKLVQCIDVIHLKYTFINNKFDDMCNEQNTTLISTIDELKNLLLSVYKDSNINDTNHIENTLQSINDIESTDDTNITVQKRSEITLQDIIDDNVQLNESFVREMKVIQDKLKAGMYIQAKSNLKRVLKLSNILDKLYDELLDRIETDISTTDTASLMYTTDFIVKALSETNNLIMAIINNEKIQNFFIIDNVNAISVSNNEVSLDQRERIRKAVSIVMSNLDHLKSGDLNKIVNPNTVVESEGEVIDVDNST